MKVSYRPEIKISFKVTTMHDYNDIFVERKHVQIEEIQVHNDQD